MIKQIAEQILELLYPSRARCLGCGDEQGCDEPFLCRECRRLLVPSSVAVQRSSWQERGLDLVLFPYYYRRPIKGLIRSFKFHSVRTLASLFIPDLADLLVRIPSVPDLIIPVPLHSSRLAERGFNQAEVLARLLSQETGIKIRTDLLRRVRRTRQQSKLKGSRRGGDLSRAFRADGDLSGKRILLLDDVITTGSTACACAAALKRAGAEEVYALAVAGSHRCRPAANRRYRLNKM